MNLEYNLEERQRLDVFLVSKLPFLSRTQIAKMIKDGLVTVDGDEAKPSYNLKPGEQIDIELPTPEPYELEPENIPVEIVHEEDDFLVAVKPQGMLTHPAGATITGTLVNAMLYYCKGKLSGMVGEQRPGIVHRLDRDTSGLIIVVKTDYAMKTFAKLFAEHRMDKRYYCICKGLLKSERTVINAPIARDFTHRWKMCVSPDGREAISKVTELERLDGYTYAEVKPVSGRTHQIRVHLSYIGHPILGDQVYGGEDSRFDLKGQLLHCGKLGFDFKGVHYELEAKPPPIFLETLERLRLTGGMQDLNSK